MGCEVFRIYFRLKQKLHIICVKSKLQLLLLYVHQARRRHLKLLVIILVLMTPSVVSILFILCSNCVSQCLSF